MDDLLLAVFPPPPSPQLDHCSPARGLRENYLKIKRARVTHCHWAAYPDKQLTHSLTSSLVFAHLAVENVLVEEALSLVPVWVPEHGVPVNLAVLKLAVEDISVLISVREVKKGTLSHPLTIVAEAMYSGGLINEVRG